MKLYTSKQINNVLKIIKIFGINIFSQEKQNDYTKIKYLSGLIKIKKSLTYKKIYFLGIQVLSKTNHLYKTLETLKSCIINETRIANSISKLHSEVFSNFKNCHNNKTIIIIGTGPTLNYYNFINKYIHIGMNRAYEKKEIKFDYYFLSHYSDITAAYINDIYNLDCTKFFGRYILKKFRNWNIPSYIINKKNTYSYYIDSYLNDFEEDITSYPFKNGGSIAFHALQFALWTHPKQILLVGCDCSMNGYYNKNIQQAAWAGYQETLKSYPMIKKFAQIYYPDIEIISVNPVGLKGLFRDVYTKSYVLDNPEMFENEENIEYLEDIQEEGDICV